MKNILLVGSGGFLGSILRYLLNGFIYRILDYPIFPYGVMVINILGCLLIGFLNGLAETREAFTPEVRIFLFIGLLGGFTTFSSFGYDTYNLLKDTQFAYALINVGVQVIIGLAGVWMGYSMSRLL